MAIGVAVANAILLVSCAEQNRLKGATGLLPMCRLAGPNGTISPPRRYGLANVAFVIQRPCHLAWSGHRPVSGVVVLPKLSKLLYQEDALSAPCQPGDSALRRRPAPGAGAAGRRNPSLLMSSHHGDKRFSKSPSFEVLAAAKSFVLSRWSNFLYFPALLSCLGLLRSRKQSDTA